MDFNKITYEKHEASLPPYFGGVWQGGQVDKWIRTIPGPLCIINLSHDEEDLKYIDKKSIHAVLNIPIDDFNDGMMDDDILIAYVDVAISLLRKGINLYIHCAAGVSRSTYFNAALHMRMMSWTPTAALAIIGRCRPCVSPNRGFRAHLDKLSHSGRIHIR